VGTCLFFDYQNKRTGRINAVIDELANLEFAAANILWL
jgi:hypothetical protein